MKLEHKGPRGLPELPKKCLYEYIPRFSKVKNYISAGILAILVSLPSATGNGENKVDFDYGLLSYELDPSAYRYYTLALQDDTLALGVANMCKKIKSETGVSFIGWDVTYLIDLHLARYSGDHGLWEEAYSRLVLGYPALLQNGLEKATVELGYNPEFNPASKI